MAKSAVSDEQLAHALETYAGMVRYVIDDPQRWLGADQDLPSTASAPARALDFVRDRAFGGTTPASLRWGERPLDLRIRWWVNRIGLSAGLAAAAPRFAGALADRVPLQAALGASAAGLAVCAAAREHGVTDPADWVPLLGRVIFGRDLGARPAKPVAPSGSEQPTESEKRLAAAAADTTEPPSTMAALTDAAQRTVRALWGLARIFLDLRDLLDERPRGGLLARGLAKLPVVGVAGGWLDERGGIKRAAKATTRLLGERSPGAT